MKNYLISFSLAAVLAVPAMAQNQTSNPPDQPQTQAQPAAQPSAPATQAQPAAQTAEAQVGATGKEPLKYERHEGFWGHLNPFARKKYVNKQLDPVRGRVNELDELTAKNAKTISDTDARATEGIRNALGKANDADAHAVDAGNRANQAQATAQTATTKVTSVEQTVSRLDQYTPISQTEIRFRPGQTILSKNAKGALDQMAETLKAQKGYILEVEGFAPGHGSSAITSSRDMAQMVVRYLVLNHDIPVYRIYTVGMGNAPLSTGDGKMHRATGGRVEINLMKNSLGDTTPNTTATAAPASSGGSPQ
jgi:outer membrane protein OmpA-like peptidoglycan-associated protein